jgi:hypothetical protein
MRRLLSIPEILEWADAYRLRKGNWPILSTGPVRGQHDDTWRNVDNALRYGLRGLHSGSSLAQLLAEHRGARNPSRLPSLSAAQILRWADSHHQRTGAWPTSESGPIQDAPGETWKAIDHALRLGMRSLRGDSSLARLLSARRGVRNIQALPPLTRNKILAWAGAYFRRHQTWPTSKSGPIDKQPGETWSGVNAALRSGRRGFPGGSSLARLLAKYRGVRNPKQPPPLTERKILRWSRTYRQQYGYWPNRHSGLIPGSGGDTWAMVDRALQKGQRTLPGKSSLYRLVNGRGNVREKMRRY